MKVDARRAMPILQNPGDVGAFLLYGPDGGLVREYALCAAKALVPDIADPFCIAILEPPDHARLEEEATALSMTGGRRVVWLREAQDTLAPALKHLLQQKTEALIIVEAGELGPRSRLRLLMEKAANAACIACYPEEGAQLEKTISTLLAQSKVRITPDALHWLAARLSADRAATRAEVEKLILYVGGKAGTELLLEDVQACIGDGAESSLDDAAFASLAGLGRDADLATQRALHEGISPVAIMRTLLRHIHRVRHVRLMIEAGTPQEEAIRSLKPPIFFKKLPLFRRTLELWNAEQLLELSSQTQRLEAACKRTNAADHVLCRHHIMVLSQRAHRRHGVAQRSTFRV